MTEVHLHASRSPRLHYWPRAEMFNVLLASQVAGTSVRKESNCGQANSETNMTSQFLITCVSWRRPSSLFDMMYDV